MNESIELLKAAKVQAINQSKDNTDLCVAHQSAIDRLIKHNTELVAQLDDINKALIVLESA